MPIGVGWKDLASYFGVSIKTVQRWHKIEKFPILKIRGSIVYRWCEINDWLKKAEGKL